MSCHEWEEGDIVLPASAWPAFKADLRNAWNALQAQRFALALELYERVLLEGKTQRNAPWSAIAARVGESLRLRNTQGHIEDEDALYLALNSILPYERRKLTGSAGKPLKPKKQDFAPAHSLTTEYRFCGAMIELHEKTRTVFWRVEENNHACDRARRQRMARAFFESLRRVSWTRGSGGDIVGNNEYHREDRHAGGGANFVKNTFGPKS